MRKVLTAVAAIAMVAAATIAASDPAEAKRHGRFWTGFGVGVGTAILFGAAARASLAAPYQPYAPVEGYYAYPVAYAAPAPIACPNGFWAARPVAFDPWGRPVRWSKPRWFCPPPGYYSVHYYYGY